MNSETVPESNKVARAIMKGMGEAGVLDYVEVARRAGLDPRTLRGAGGQTSVDILESIAKALGGELDISITIVPEVDQVAILRNRLFDRDACS